MSKPNQKQRRDRVGRPNKLEPDEATLTMLTQLAQIQCTMLEAAAVLGVSGPTFHKFLNDHEKAKDAWLLGKENGKASLRRMQWKTAQTSATMQIWLGKQYLEQRDKSERDVHVYNHEDLLDMLDEEPATDARPSDGTAIH